MKKLLLGLIIASVAVAMSPGHAKVKTISSTSMTFTATAPCSVLCDYGNLEEGDDYACAPNAMLPQSYSSKNVRIPKGANFLIFTARPEADWDIFVCRGGKVLRYSAINYIDEPGRIEQIGMFVKPGLTYILRAFAFHDVSPLPATLQMKYLKTYR